MRGTTSWAYQYNALDAITQETLTVDGLTFTTGYTRNADGYVTHQTTPAGRSVRYLPDGFGRATRVRVGSTKTDWTNRFFFKNFRSRNRFQSRKS